MEQDFTKRIAIAVNKQLPSWQVLNAVAHIAAYLGNKMQERFDTGEFFVTKDEINHPRSSQYPIVIFSASPIELPAFVAAVRASGLPYLGFIREMIETINDSEIVEILKEKPDAEIEYYGVGVFGENEKVKTLTKKLSLWK